MFNQLTPSLWNETRRGKDWFKIRDLLADACSQAVLAVLSTMDMARRVPARLRKTHRVTRRSGNSGS